MAKGAKTVFVCGECGYESSKWLGRCPNCESWNTFVEAAPVQQIKRAYRHSVRSPCGRFRRTRRGAYQAE